MVARPLALKHTDYVKWTSSYSGAHGPSLVSHPGHLDQGGAGKIFVSCHKHLQPSVITQYKEFKVFSSNESVKQIFYTLRAADLEHFFFFLSYVRMSLD